VREGRGPALYDFAAQAEAQRALTTRPLLPYLNPPQVALALAPLARVSFGAAFATWTVVQVALLLWLLRMVTRGRPPLEGLAAAAAVLAAPPMLLTLTLGAFSLLMLVVVLRLRESLASERPTAGLWLTLGLVKPQLVALPALAPLVGRRWRTVVVAAAGALLVIAVSAAAFGPRIWIDFARALATAKNDPGLGLHLASMYNLEGALRLALGDAPGLATVGVLGFVAAMAATVWLWREPWLAGDPRLDLRLAATVLLGAFLGPHLYPQDGLMIVGAALLFDNYLRGSGRPRALFAALALASPPVWFISELVLSPRLVRFPVLLELALGALIARELRRSRQAMISAR
jgi:hypothetical protein